MIFKYIFLFSLDRTLTTALHGHGHPRLIADAGVAAGWMLAVLRHLVTASRAHAAVLDDPSVDERAASRELRTAYDIAFDN